jgi:murein L,D-transpeptidase YafK
VVFVELAVLVVLGGVWLRGHLTANAAAAMRSAQIVGADEISDEPVMQPVSPPRRAPHPSQDLAPATPSRELPPLRQPAILIEKSRRRLTVYDQGRAVKSYLAAVGGVAGDKVRKGDRRTPEGQFYVCAKLGEGESSYTRALHLSYPNVEHAQRGLRDGIISRTDYYRIVPAIREGQIPPQNTKLGSHIMIHGKRLGYDRKTEGCIALEDADIIQLFSRIPIGTPVVIRP